MKDLVNHIMNAIKGQTAIAVEAKTGIHRTRVFRLLHGAEAKVWELIAIAEAYDITPMGMTLEALEKIKANALAEIEAVKKTATEKAFQEAYESAEIHVAKKYGMTPELMAWKLTAPAKVAV